MILAHRAARAAALLLALPAACSKEPDNGAATTSTMAPSASVMPGPASLFPSPAPDMPARPPGDDPAAFVPLRSDAVKDAIHRALRTGATQRWRDGELSGYAVPSVAAGANGCRAVRYTVDQRPDTGYGSITACDASR